MIVPRLRSPIVLVHGLLGFTEIKLCGWTLARYFPGIPEALTQAGNRVLQPWLGMTHSVAERAGQLKKYLDRNAPHEPVHILAHSMGGLDARYMISRLGMAERVLSLTTLGTPHRGSAFADWSIRRIGRIVGPVLDLCGVPRGAFRDLTMAECKRFNAEVRDAPSVRYFSVAGRYEGAMRNLQWKLYARVLEREEGENDGLVSLSSARYGEACDIWDGDHLTLINWPHPKERAAGRWTDRQPHYAGLVQRLADAGF
jgi:triacylglycerol lipase